MTDRHRDALERDRDALAGMSARDIVPAFVAWEHRLLTYPVSVDTDTVLADGTRLAVQSDAAGRVLAVWPIDELGVQIGPRR